MLAIISDLHLQQTRYDSLRYRRDGVVRQTGVHRNVKKEAFERLFRQLLDSAERHQAAELHLVFAGDIFELHRTPLWFMGETNDVRPTDALAGGASDRSLRETVRRIVREVAEEHAEVWAAIQGFVDLPPTKRPKLTVHYLPGNHDRLINAWPSIRAEARRLLGMDASDKPFPIRLDFTAQGIADYGVRIRHGQEYDPPNFAHSTAKKTALDVDWEGYLVPAFGDYITVDVATRLALAFRARYGAAMRTGLGEELRRLYLALHEFDDVRPASLLVDYLVKQMGAHRRATFDILRPILRDALETAVATPFFAKYAKQHVPGILLKLLPELLKNLSGEAIEQAIRTFIDLPAKDRPSPAERAQHEFDAGEGFDLVVGGHTHRPEQVSMPSRPEGRPTLYLNSGTWRTTLPAGVESFGRLRAYTFIICYNAAEQSVETADGRRFETWTGHLSSDALGPYDEPAHDLPSAPAGTRQLRFKSLEVLDIQREIRGAELKVNLGVDDQPRVQKWVKVKPGITYPIELDPLPLDPHLDGDVWFYGDEVDLGTSIINMDDPLPWGFHRLPREPDSGQFEIGPGRMNMKGLRRAHLRLYFEVEPVV